VAEERRRQVNISAQYRSSCGDLSLMASKIWRQGVLYLFFRVRHSMCTQMRGDGDPRGLRSQIDHPISSTYKGPRIEYGMKTLHQIRSCEDKSLYEIRITMKYKHNQQTTQLKDKQHKHPRHIHPHINHTFNPINAHLPQINPQIPSILVYNYNARMPSIHASRANRLLLIAA